MKYLFSLCLFLSGLFVFAHNGAISDTITNWQLYKNGVLEIRSNVSETELQTVTIGKSEYVQRMAFLLYHEGNEDLIPRTVELIHDGRALITYKEEEYSYRPFWLKANDIKEYMITNNISKFEIRYSDNILEKPVILGYIELVE